MYTIEFTDLSEKQIRKLDRQVQARIFAILERCRVRPERHLRRLVGMDLYRLRAGDYRILIKLDQGKLIILVVEVGHRRNIYD